MAFSTREGVATRPSRVGSSPRRMRISRWSSWVEKSLSEPLSICTSSSRFFMGTVCAMGSFLSGGAETSGAKAQIVLCFGDFRSNGLTYLSGAVALEEVVFGFFHADVFEAGRGDLLVEQSEDRST